MFVVDLEIGVVLMRRDDFRRIFDELHCLDGKSGSSGSIDWRRQATLLNMARNGGFGVEFAVGLLFYDIGKNLGGKHLGSIGALQDQLPALGQSTLGSERFLKRVDVGLQLIQWDAFFWDVRSLGAAHQCRIGGDVARVSTLDLDHESTVSGGGGGLFDDVAVLHQRVQTGVGAQRVLCSRDVVGDGGWNQHHGDAE